MSGRILCQGVSKRYLRGTFPQMIASTLRQQPWNERWFWALRDISFSVANSNQWIGVVGTNGSGKSTLLKIIAGVTIPTQGQIMVRGRVTPLLELFSGMQFEMTGRENILLNGVVLGMRRREVLRKMDSIVHFAGLESFVNMPVKHYSSGMIMRLGFSIAVHVDADILLVDEAWGVGDVVFQSRSMERLQELRRSGVTVFVVSHDPAILQRLTDQTLWLDGGSVQSFGPTPTVLAAYLAAMKDQETKI